jgi:hypothetical protein
MERKPRRSFWTQARAGRCPACGRAFGRRDQRVRAGGLVFHRACAVYEPRATGVNPTGS